MSGIDWEICPSGPKDLEETETLLLAAFASGAEAKLTAELRAGGHAVIELIAQSEGRVVGYLMLTAMREPEGTLALAPVATKPGLEGQGIASSLIETGLAAALAEDWRGVFVLGDAAFYKRFGFSVEAARPFEGPYTGEHFALAILDDDLPPRGRRAVYPEPFEALG